MTTYEYKARTITDAKLDEKPYLHSALELGATLVNDLIQEGNFASVKIGPSAYNVDKTEMDPTATYFLTRLMYLPSERLVLFTNDDERISIHATVRGQNSPSGLEGRVLVRGDEDVLRKYETLKARSPIVKQT